MDPRNHFIGRCIFQKVTTGTRMQHALNNTVFIYIAHSDHHPVLLRPFDRSTFVTPITGGPVDIEQYHVHGLLPQVTPHRSRLSTLTTTPYPFSVLQDVFKPL